MVHNHSPIKLYLICFNSECKGGDTMWITHYSNLSSKTLLKTTNKYEVMGADVLWHHSQTQFLRKIRIMMLSIYIAFSIFTTLYLANLPKLWYLQEWGYTTKGLAPCCHVSPQKYHFTMSVPMGMIAPQDGLKPDNIDWLILASTLKEPP